MSAPSKAKTSENVRFLTFLNFCVPLHITLRNIRGNHCQRVFAFVAMFMFTTASRLQSHCVSFNCRTLTCTILVISSLMNSSALGYDYSNPLKSRDVSKLDPLLALLIQTTAFQRLKDVRFLGGIDYVLVPAPNGAPNNTRYNRFQHSIGVALLATKYAEARELPENLRLLAAAAALLHDVGHAPLSHSLEPLFERAFGIDHHQATTDIILGRSGLGNSVWRLLIDSGLDPEEVVEVINGRHDPFEGFFAGPINFDTIEGILRSRQYLKPGANAFTPEAVLMAAINRTSKADANVVDRFWSYKDDVYRFLIRSERGVLADHICQHFAEKAIHRLSKVDYFSSEQNFFKKVPEVRKFLKSRVARRAEMLPKGESVPYKLRSFHVHSASDFFSREDCNRYRQEKIDGVLSIPSLDKKNLDEIEARHSVGTSLRQREKFL